MEAVSINPPKLCLAEADQHSVFQSLATSSTNYFILPEDLKLALSCSKFTFSNFQIQTSPERFITV